MTFTAGIDTYATVDEADDYINTYYLSVSPERTTWLGLANGDKESMLRQAAQAIDAVQYTGSRQAAGQPLAFPRYSINNANNYQQPFSTSSLVTTDIARQLAKVKEAQICEAATRAFMVIDSLSNGGNGNTNDVGADEGVSSYSIGGLSESYAAGAVEQRADSQGLKVNIKNEHARSLLKRWTNGSFRIS